MQIRTKLFLNIFIVLTLLICIVGFSYFAFHNVKTNLKFLTEKTSPFQIRILDLERSLQLVIAELNRVFTFEKEEDLKTASERIKKYLDDVKVKEEKLLELSGEKTGNRIHKTFQEVSDSIISASLRKIELLKEAYKISADVVDKNRELNNRVEKTINIVKTYQTSSTQVVTQSIGKVVDIDKTIKQMQNVRIFLKDLYSFVLELSHANDRRKVIVSRGRIQGVLSKLKEESKTLDKVIVQEIEEINKFSEELIKIKEANPEKVDEKFVQAEKFLKERINAVEQKTAVEQSALQEKHKTERETLTTLNVQAGSATQAVHYAGDLLASTYQIESSIQRILNAETQEAVNNLKGNIDRCYERLRNNLKLMQNLFRQLKFEKELKEMENISASYSAFRGIVSRLVETKLQVISAEQRMREELKKLQDIAELYRQKGAQKIGEASGEQEKAITAVNKTMSVSLSLLTVVGIVAIAIGIILGIWILKSMTKPLAVLNQFANNLSQGCIKFDNTKIDKNEIGKVIQAIQSTSCVLVEIIEKIQRVTEELSKKSSKLGETAKRLNEGSDIQFKEVNSAQNIALEVENTSQEVSKLMNSTTSYVEGIKQGAIASKDVIKRGSESFSHFVTSVKGSVEKVVELSENSKEVRSVLTLITDIAEQIQLLALNATIEAARAGEYGRGFAVVADHIKQLAERTTEVAKEVNSKIENMLRNIDNTVNLLESEQKNLQEVFNLITSLIETMDKIINDIVQISNMVGNVAEATEQQRSAIEDINRSMKKVAELTNQVKKTVSELTSISSSMQESSLDLKDAISWFKI